MERKWQQQKINKKKIKAHSRTEDFKLLTPDVKPWRNILTQELNWSSRILVDNNKRKYNDEEH